MVLVLSLAVTIVALLFTERGVWRLGFASAAVATLASVIMLASGDLERAVPLAGLCVVAVIGASMVKFHHSARTLIVADFALGFAGTVPFFFAQYRRMMTGLIAGGAVLVCAAIAVGQSAPGLGLSVAARAVVLGICLGACAVAYRANGGRAVFRQTVTQPYGYVSTFAGSVADVRSWWPSDALGLIEIADDPLPLLQPIAARGTVFPDIILIQHESVFDPRLFGLPVEPHVAAFLTPPDGMSGGLDVEIYGGGSWQSEFSVMTGVSSAAFGADGYYLFTKGVGRFHHSLPNTLGALGYRTQLVSSCRRNFLNYDAFYRSIGMAQRTFSDDFPAPFDVARFEQTYSDAVFFPAMLEALMADVDRDPAPRFLYALTNFNHGPHNRGLGAPVVSDAARAFALSALPDAAYGDYYARLSETATAWRRAKAALAAVTPARPMLIVHYGDHQPVMTRRIEAKLGLAADPSRTFVTFNAIEGINFTPQPIGACERDLGIAYLNTRLLEAAGLPFDAIAATRASLCDGDLGDAVRHTREGQLLRTLVDQGLIELGPIA